MSGTEPDAAKPFDLEFKPRQPDGAALGLNDWPWKSH
jgi:hypothetical protein